MAKEGERAPRRADDVSGRREGVRDQRSIGKIKDQTNQQSQPLYDGGNESEAPRCIEDQIVIVSYSNFPILHMLHVCFRDNPRHSKNCYCNITHSTVVP